LQSRYPSGAYSVGVSDIDLSADNLLSGSAVYQTHYSSVELRDADVTTSHDFRFGNTDPALIFVGSLEQMYKGPDILLHAVAICRRRGHNIRLTIVGDGRHRHQLERLAENLGVRQLVTFAGTLPSGKAVWDALDAAWIFVLPSRTEGLPRAMVEAMARGLPCIGSRVGGIPELLPPEDTVEPGDPQQLAAKIAEFVNDRKRLETASQRNLRKAHEYRDQELRPRRLSFYRHIRDVTADWILRERAA
jgi:glycosyltransferase involved in cell wall biosynthesis